MLLIDEEKEDVLPIKKVPIKRQVSLKKVKEPDPESESASDTDTDDDWFEPPKKPLFKFL
jgi:hypothetical protein